MGRRRVYSDDLALLALTLWQRERASFSQIAVRLGLSKNVVQRLVERARKDALRPAVERVTPGIRSK